MQPDETTTHAPRIPSDAERRVTPNFITDIIDEDIESGRVSSVVTRFPPEPNGYLHIGHAKAVCLDFGVAQDYGGVTFLRYDDTNPAAEDPEFARAIEKDLRWLGFEWIELRHASDYFEQLYAYATTLIERGLAYVDSLNEDEIREYRGTVTEPGRPSPYRERSVQENLDLFRRMRAGEFSPGQVVLRAKIDLAATNMKMRDPILYRIVEAKHWRTGHEWPIYPMYDFAHPLSDAIEGVTHSLCTLEFDNNREVYDWLLDQLTEGPRPHQYEFARLNLDHTVMSKRKLARLVREGHVSSWDDPRMPTLSAMRRRGVTPEAIKDLTNRVGVSKANSRTSPTLLDYSIREDLNHRAKRVLAVLEPLRVELTDLPGEEVVMLDAAYWPHDVPREGSRPLPLTREIVIERGDFEEDAPKGFKRLAPGRAVRLRHGPVIRCDEVLKDAAGTVTGLRCSRVAESADEPVKVWATIHWVSATHGLPLEARLYQPLFTVPDPDGGDDDLTKYLNPEALVVKRGLIEPSVVTDPMDERYQFERLGYFWRDPVDGRGDALVFNRIVALKDGFAPAKTGPAKDDPAKSASKSAVDVAKTQRATPPAESGATPETTAATTALATEFGIGLAEAGVLSARSELETFFRATVAAGAPAGEAAGWVINEVARELKTGACADVMTPATVAELIGLVANGTLTARVAKELLTEIAKTGASPRELVAARGLERVSDAGAVAAAVSNVLRSHPDELASYRDGKASLRGFFVGQVMRALSGRADPAVVQSEVAKALDA
ncbi:MAG: glutamine--tRNA ligase/YqeY domain fusion protein [Trueperaceae bacterium]|nr:glutamine--tRNA ligase/YqeY domain fusion protein [Trueperaceae bacterium]